MDYETFSLHLFMYMDKWALQEGGTLQLTRKMPSCGRGTLLRIIIIQFKQYYMYVGKDFTGLLNHDL